MLSQKRLSSKIEDLVKSNPGGDEGIKYFAENLAKVIIEEIKEATVTVDPGINVQVIYPAGTGATIATGSGSLS